MQRCFKHGSAPNVVESGFAENAAMQQRFVSMRLLRAKLSRR
jgi:hypothetical protein